MKKALKSIGISVMVLSLMVGGSFITSHFNTTPIIEATESTANSITVTGKGSITVTPDMAYVTLGVRTENEDAKVAQEENSEKMNDVILAIKSLGVNEDDIQTANFNLYPQYNYTDNERKLNGYIVEHTLEVTVRDIDKVGPIIDASIEEGANVTNNIQFTISNSEEAYAQALVVAVNNAKSKAEAIANTLGVTITTPKSVIEQSTYNAPVTYVAFSEKMTADTDSAMPVESGELEINANISVVYEY